LRGRRRESSGFAENGESGLMRRGKEEHFSADALLPRLRHPQMHDFAFGARWLHLLLLWHRPCASLSLDEAQTYVGRILLVYLTEKLPVSTNPTVVLIHGALTDVSGWSVSGKLIGRAYSMLSPENGPIDYRQTRCSCRTFLRGKCPAVSASDRSRTTPPRPS
jgi:hypothetical protein